MFAFQKALNPKKKMPCYSQLEQDGCYEKCKSPLEKLQPLAMHKKMQQMTIRPTRGQNENAECESMWMLPVISSIRGYHEYRSIWRAEAGQHLNCLPDGDNQYDANAVALIRHGEIVGHVPAELCAMLFSYIVAGGRVKARVTGRPFNRGKGMEVPATYYCSGSEDNYYRLKAALERTGGYGG